MAIIPTTRSTAHSTGPSTDPRGPEIRIPTSGPCLPVGSTTMGPKKPAPNPIPPTIKTHMRNDGRCESQNPDRIPPISVQTRRTWPFPAPYSCAHRSPHNVLVAYTKQLCLVSHHGLAAHYASHSTTRSSVPHASFQSTAIGLRNTMKMRIVNKETLPSQALTLASGESISSQWQCNERAMEGQTKREP